MHAGKKTYRKEAVIPEIQANAACIAKLPPLRTRDLSPRIQITVRNNVTKQKSSTQVSNSPQIRQWEDDSPSRKHNLDNLALSAIDSMNSRRDSNRFNNLPEPQDPSFYQPIKKEMAPLAGINKYARKQRRPPSNLFEIKESKVESPQLRLYQSIKQGAAMAPTAATKFIGSGGY